MSKRRLFIGIGGGSGSGKTTLAKRLQDSAPEGAVAIVEVDAYYREINSLPPRDREQFNFDHPDAIDWELLLADLHALREGQSIEQPVYDFTRHGRGDEVLRLEPSPVVIVEGIHALSRVELRELVDIRIFVDTDPDIRFIRRLRRDILDRDRSIDSVVEQYMATVRPMYVDYVEPSRRHADIILPEGSCNDLGLELVVEALSGRIWEYASADQ